MGKELFYVLMVLRKAAVIVALAGTAFKWL